MMTNLLSSSVVRLRFLLVMLVMMFAATNMWGAVLFHETFGTNTGSVRDWNNSYSVKSGQENVYFSTTYTMTNAGQSKNTVGYNSTSGLSQRTQNKDAVFELGALNVSNYEDLVVTYYWKAGSIKGTYTTKLYYKTSKDGQYFEVTKKAGTGATTFVQCTYELPRQAECNTLYLKVIFNTSNTQACIDEFEITGNECITEPSVTLNPNGGTFASTPPDGWTKDGNNYVITHTGTEITLPTNISQEGKIFGGWYKEETKYETIPADLTESITLTAKWSDKQDSEIAWNPTTCTVTIDAGEELPIFQNPNGCTDITFNSSNSTVASVDDKGVITLGTTSTTATVTITATFAGNATYVAKEATCTLTVNPSNCRWEEVTIDDIEYGDEVVVVMVHGETLYALPYDSETASNSNPEATTITTDYFAGTVDETLIWYIMKGDDNNFTLSPKTADNKYLTCNSSNNAVRIDTDSERYFTIENGFLKNTTYNTYLAISTTANPKDWRHFTSNNTTIANKFQTLKFYKRECLDASKVWVEGNLTNVTCSPQLPQQLAKDGSITLTFTVAYGYVLPNDVTVSNATKTWNKEDGILTISNPTGNVEVTISALQTYTINYAAGSGDGIEGSHDSQTKIHGTGITLADKCFTRPGYTQTGWSKTDGGQKDYDLLGIYGTNENVTLYPYWTKVHTITWMADDSKYDEATYLDGETLSLPETNPEACQGSEFVGWTDDENYSHATDAPTYVTAGSAVTTDAIYYAVYAEEPEGEPIEEITKSYTFTSYTAGSQYAENEEHILDEDVTIYTTQCHFTTELRIYASNTHNGYVESNKLPGNIISIGFNAGDNSDNLLVYGSENGSDWNQIGKVAVNSSYKDYSLSFGETNYTYFKLDVEGSNQIRIKSMTITYMSGSGEPSAAYANYSTSCIPTYHVNYELAGGENGCANGSVKVDSAYTICDAEPTKTGYTFQHWTDGTNTYEAGATIGNVQSNITLTAVWEANTYTITWMSNGEEYVTTTHTYDQPLHITDAPYNCYGAKTFIGWTEAASVNENGEGITYIEESTNPSEKKTYYAVFADEVIGEPEEVKATLSFADKAQRTSFSSEQQVWEQNGITLTNTQGNADNDAPVADYGNPARFYANSSISIQAPGNITEIVFACSSDSYVTPTKNSVGNSAKSDGNNVIVALSSSSNTFDIAKVTAQIRLNSLTVTYQSTPETAYSNYTTTPSGCPEIEVAENAYVTSTSGQSVKVKVPVTISNYQDGITLSASIEGESNFTIANISSITEGTATLEIAYKPTDYNTTENTTVTILAKIGENKVTATDFTITGRSLPEKFAIVAEKDGKYYALPADMPSAGTYAGYEVEVKDNAVVTAPATYVYSLSAVHNTRYADNGTAVRFVGNDNKCLWASVSKNAPTSIRNFAGIENAQSYQYEWTLNTQDGKTYTITSSTTTGRQLRMYGANLGLYASGANTFRFLPIQTKTYTTTALSSKFSVAKDKKVQFSAGNLQYHTGDNAWRFAEQQYYYMGDNNKNISNPEFKDWIDMFGWSADGKFGVNTSIDNNDYQGEFVDWGTLFPDEWYTLSKNEWLYLLFSRTNAANLKQLAKVGDVYGVLLFPDEWVMPNDITPSMEDTYSTYTLDQWEQLEAAGAVFLPAAGRRIGNNQVNTNYYTYYWTNTKEAENKVYYLINCNALGNDQYEYALPQLWYEKGYYGQSVRLVRECIEPEKPQALPSTFSVSATEKVQFSAGNLQYHTGEQVWRFAPEQYDVVGQPNTNIGNSNFKDWVDMFGWSADGNFGVNASNDQSNYNGKFVDWGKVFSDAKYGISADEWYTLSMNEWYYLLYTRTNASSLKQVAIVGEMIGVLLFPDNWVMPAGVTTSLQTDADGVEYYPYTLDQWKQLEAAGAVFLPAAGRRTGGWGNETVSPHIEDKDNQDNFDSEGYYRWQDNTNYYGYYWTSTKDSDDKTYFLITCKMSDDGETGNPSLPSLWKEDGRYGQSVRLVRKCAQLQVVEWKENSIVIMYNGDPAQTATVTINNEQKGTATLSEVAKDIAVYELPATGLASSPNQPLEIAIGNAKALMTIPYIATGNATNAPANSDLVILKDATYTANGEQLRNVTVYGGGILVVGEGETLSTNSLTLRAGGVTADGNYDYVYPEFVLNGTWSNTANVINLDYLTTKEQYYTFVAPFAVQTKEIHYPIDIYGSNVAAGNRGSFEFQYYDGEARATGATGWKTVEENPTNGATLTQGMGYTFLGMPKKVKVNGGTSTRQKFGIHRIPMNVTAAEAMAHEASEQQSAPLSVHLADKNNNSGWNLIGNPYMATITGLTNTDIQVGKLVQTNGTWHWDTSVEENNQRFLVIPSNDGQSYKAVQASNATLPAFKNFFVQISNEGANALSIPRTTPAAQLLAPARRTEEVVKDVEVAIVLEQDEAHTDQMDFLINNIYTEDFERDADFTKMMNATNLNLYGVHPYDNLSFVAIDNNTARGSVAIGYQVPQAGEYILRMSDKPYVMFDKIEALYVTDHEMSPEVTTDIMSEPYRFTVANAETNHTRFTVSVILKTEEDDGGGDVGTGVDNTTNNNTPCKFIYQDKMYILRNGVIYDAMGKQVQTINK